MLKSQSNDLKAIAFFDAVRLAYEQAERSSPKSERFYAIAGYTLQLSFAGDALLRLLTPSLDHLRTTPTPNPDLRVCLWDTVSTGVELPDRPWAWDTHIARSDVTSLTSARFQTAYNLPHRLLNMLDQEQNLAFYCTYDAAQIPFHFSGSPLLDILHWWMRSHQHQYVHAGAIGLPNKGVLLVGAGGSGKSTTALSSLKSDLVYVSDDYCLITSTPEPYAYNLYNSAKLNSTNLHRFPDLWPAISNKTTLEVEKAVIFLQEHYREKLSPGFPIRAVMMPRITGATETRIIPASRMEGLKAMMVSTLMQLADANDLDVKAMSSFVRQVPCYTLEAGTDLDRLIGSLCDFLLAV